MYRKQLEVRVASRFMKNLQRRAKTCQPGGRVVMMDYIDVATADIRRLARGSLGSMRLGLRER